MAEDRLDMDKVQLPRKDQLKNSISVVGRNLSRAGSPDALLVTPPSTTEPVRRSSIIGRKRKHEGENVS